MATRLTGAERAGRRRLAAAVALLSIGSLALASSAAGDISATPSGLVANGSVSGIVASGGNIYIGGSFTQIGPRTGSGVGIDTASGQSTGLPEVAGALQAVNAVASDGGGGWFIGGSFGHVGGVARNNIAHILANGTVDPAWDPNASGTVHALAVFGSTVYVGGDFTTIGGQPRVDVAALSAATGLATGWNPGANSAVTAFALGPGGSPVYTAGGFTMIGNQPRSGIAALNPATGLATGWNPCTACGGTTYAVAVSGATVYLGGSFGAMGGQPRNNIAAVNAGTGTATSWNPNASSSVRVIAVAGSTVYAGGDFIAIGANGQPTRNHLAALDNSVGNASGWDPNAQSGVNSPLFTTVNTLLVSGSTVYAGGAFDTIGGQARGNLAALDAAGTGTATGWNPNVNGEVRSIGSSGSTLYAGGAFSSLGGQTRNGLAAIDAASGALTAWNPNADDRVTALGLGPDGTIYAGGFFATVGGQPRNGLAALNPLTGAASAFNPNPTGSIFTIVASGSTVYVGGSFATIGGQTRHNIAALDPTSGLATGWNPNAGNSVRALALSGSTVYAGGDFTTMIGGQPRNYIAALDTTSGNATGWNPSADSNVYSLLVSGSTVYVGGNFTTIGGQPRNDLAALDAAGTGTATGWNPDVTSPPPFCDTGCPVTALALSGSTVYAGGSFSFVGGQPRAGVAAIDAATGAPTSWNPGAGGNVDALAFGPDGSLYAGGSFGGFDLIAQSHFATFRTPPVPPPPPVVGSPGVVAGAPVVIGTRGAGFTAVINPHGLATSMHFEYGLDSSLRGLVRAAAIVYDQRTPEQPVGSDFANHTVNATVSGLLPNALYHVRAVATNSAGVAASGDQAFRTAADPPPPPPVLGRTVDAYPVSGLVFVKGPPGAMITSLRAPPSAWAAQALAALVKGQGFIPLTEARQLPVGTQFDTRIGAVKLVTASTKKNQTFSGTFQSALFKELQSRNRRQRGLTVLQLLEGAFPGAPAYSQCAALGKSGRASIARKINKHVLQLLRANVNGRFQTRGRYSAATVRGTKYDVSDRCDGTLTVVRRGTVVVRDFRRRINITLHAGKSYLAKTR